MPVRKVGPNSYQWGNSGKVYSGKGAKAKAERQGRAIYASGYRGSAEEYGAESYKPPASAIANAKRGLKLRKEWGRGGLSPSEAKSQGIDSGVTRARKIASGKVSRHDVRRMSAFNRHRKNYRPDKKMSDGGPTAGTIAWLLWGGTSGVNWAKKKSATMNAESFEADLMFKDWSEQEMMSHGDQDSFEDWLEHEIDKHGNISLRDWGDDEEKSHLKRYGAETQDFAAQEWESWIHLATQCSCGRTVEPYEYKINENNKVVDVKYKCDCGGGICRATNYGYLGRAVPCNNKAEYRGLCSYHATCQRCNKSLKEDYEYWGRDEGHDDSVCNQCYEDTVRYGAEDEKQEYIVSVPVLHYYGIGPVKAYDEGGAISEVKNNWRYWRGTIEDNGDWGGPLWRYYGIDIREPSAYLNAEDWGGDPDGPLAKALAKARESMKQPRKPLQITRLPDPNQKTLKDFEANWQDLPRNELGQWQRPVSEEVLQMLVSSENMPTLSELLAMYGGDTPTNRWKLYKALMDIYISNDPTEDTIVDFSDNLEIETPEEYYQFILQEELDIPEDEDDTQTIEFWDRYSRYVASVYTAKEIEFMIAEAIESIDLFADEGDLKEITALNAALKLQPFMEKYRAE